MGDILEYVGQPNVITSVLINERERSMDRSQKKRYDKDTKAGVVQGHELRFAGSI